MCHPCAAYRKTGSLIVAPPPSSFSHPHTMSQQVLVCSSSHHTDLPLCPIQVAYTLCNTGGEPVLMIAFNTAHVSKCCWGGVKRQRVTQARKNGIPTAGTLPSNAASHQVPNRLAITQQHKNA
eukprot:1149683-Pelagomonas_calceolata.AAC.9